MEQYLKEIFAQAKEQQVDGQVIHCPRCGAHTFTAGDIANAMSRYVDVAICNDCAKDEAARDLAHKPLRLTRWRVVRDALCGRTFLDLLRDQARKQEALRATPHRNRERKIW